MFDFLGMVGDYEDRKVDRHESPGLIVSTARVIDSDDPYETAVSHGNYNGGEWIIVETYGGEPAARKGHARWVQKMTTEPLPEQLTDASKAAVAKWADAVAGDEDWRTREQETAE